MKLYHGSPKILTSIKPKLAKGITPFENKKAIFLCKTFNHAALYAISKSLKEKTAFAVTERRLVIVGKRKPKNGYVYTVDVKAKKGTKGQYSYDKEIKEFKTKKVLAKDYTKQIKRFKNLKELKKYLKI